MEYLCACCGFAQPQKSRKQGAWMKGYIDDAELEDTLRGRGGSGEDNKQNNLSQVKRDAVVL